MKIPSRISQSRHGIYYYRLQFTVSGKRQERRLSLCTKDPIIAKEKSLLLSAALVADRRKLSMANDDVSIKQTLQRLGDTARDLKIAWNGPNGQSVVMEADPDKPADLEALKQASEAFWNSELGQSFKREESPAVQPTQPPQPEVGGMTLEEAIKRYATRQGPKLAAKTLYEYGNYHRIFLEWLNARHKTKNIPIRDVNRQDVSIFIDDLLAQGISHHTIQQKYLAAISGLFALAQAEGSFPEGSTFPSRGHKLLTKREAKKTQGKRSYKPFTDQDLKDIFNPKTYLAQRNPTDYWLPLLALFTGGRISELCQLLTHDVRKIGEIWAIAITDEDESQRLKTPAAKRTIPLHPQLIKLGFLDFVDDMASFGGMLFPYLTANKFSNFSETPSERWGSYLDTIGISDRKKVFHSFRSTSNNRLKQNGVSEETRCQFIGHEYDTVNSTNYAELHNVAFLLEHAASKLNFDVDFTVIPYPRETILAATKRKLKVKQRWEKHRAMKVSRE
ncbi:tyrosine-type recombinase/integrase [Burkholderia pseudomallei]|uniref:tyrosine-type recombinase/integrase n=1 Tax=Burkholderia pseudomallei TaxID=28450 RepID=UPI0011AF2121|nr:hypothetical protein [Burkholderia pseudomallei]